MMNVEAFLQQKQKIIVGNYRFLEMEVPSSLFSQIIPLSSEAVHSREVMSQSWP